ncbi:hypothetical protein QBC44DRAFT_337947 [Cladorrhinum sp. PSN332]|nr:hypothetical protein QBC44DRAFT_337947 [Cladorrhinum sp. PSN332]
MGNKLLKVTFPLPAVESSIKTRIARKSSYIEITGNAITDISKAPSCSFTYPTIFSKTKPGIHPAPTPWNMPHLNLASLPAINIEEKNHQALSWVSLHLSHMWSKHEKLLRKNPWQRGSKEERARINFKDSLFAIFMQFAGFKDAQGAGLRSSIFVLNCEEAGVLDAAVMTATLDLVYQQARVM